MDKDTFTRCIEENLDAMYRVAYTITRNEEDSRDAVQESVLKAWEKRNTLRDLEAFRPWLLRILTNCCYNLLRKRKRIVSLDAVEEPSVPPPDPALEMLVQSLPEKLRLPLMLSCAEHMTYREIASALRLPLSTVTGRIRMAKEMLRKELNEA